MDDIYNKKKPDDRRDQPNHDVDPHQQVTTLDLAGYEAVGRGDGAGIVGVLCRFVKGEYYIGKGTEARELPLGSKLLCDMATACRGWAYWKDGRIVDPSNIRPLTANVRMPARSELSEFGQEAKWALGPNGRPRDPWQPDFRMLCYTLDDCEELTFVSSSWGGQHCLTGLCRDYVRWRAAHPDPELLPIIALKSKIAVSKLYGRIPEPRFEIVGGGTLADCASGRLEALMEETKRLERPMRDNVVVEDAEDEDLVTAIDEDDEDEEDEDLAKLDQRDEQSEPEDVVRALRARRSARTAFSPKRARLVREKRELRSKLTDLDSE